MNNKKESLLSRTKLAGGVGEKKYILYNEGKEKDLKETLSTIVYSNKNDYLLPLSVYNYFNDNIDMGYKYVAANAFSDTNLQDVYTVLPFTGSHGSRISNGAILYNPITKQTVNYADYMEYKTLPPVADNNSKVLLPTLYNKKNDFYGRTTWNDTTTITLRDSDDDTFNSTNWVIILIKTYGAYGLYANGNEIQIPDPIRTKYDLNGKNGELVTETLYSIKDKYKSNKEETDFSPYVLKTYVHIFMPGGKYERRENAKWFYNGKNGFDWNSGGEKSNIHSNNWNGISNIASIPNNLDRLRTGKAKNIFIGNTEYSLINWSSDNPENDKIEEAGKEKIKYNFWAHPTCGI